MESILNLFFVWRESVFGNELMTRELSTLGNPLSVVTLGAMADLGYVVKFTAADAYRLPQPNSIQADGLDLQADAPYLQVDASDLVDMGNDVIIFPRLVGEWRRHEDEVGEGEGDAARVR